MTAPKTQPASLHLEIHMIRSVNPSNLNRDDTGAPKDAVFGGVRRLRYSSQAQKYAYRDDFKNSDLLKPGEIGIRSKLFRGQLVTRLVDAGHDAEQAFIASTQALIISGLAEAPKEKKPPKKAKVAKAAVRAPVEGVVEEADGEVDGETPVMRDLETKALMFLSVAELDTLAGLIGGNLDALVTLESSSKGPPKELVNLFKSSLDNNGDGRRAVDVGLFGRMIAQHPEKGVDGAVQVANAIGTHALTGREYDYYTAIDDLQRDADSGSSMIGTNEFSSGTLYQYLTVDVRALHRTLDGDTELLGRGLEALLRAALLRLPGGRMSGSASYLTPSLALLTVRRGQGPRNLVNAFERPVRAANGSGYVEPSIEALAAELDWQNRCYGPASAAHVLSRTDTKGFGTAAPDMDTLVRRTLDEVLSGLSSAAAAD